MTAASVVAHTRMLSKSSTVAAASAVSGHAPRFLFHRGTLYRLEAQTPPNAVPCSGDQLLTTAFR